MRRTPVYKILVVDDMALIREPVTAALKTNGYDAQAAESGQAAIEKLRQWPADVILLDIKMPNMDGIETLRALRGLRGHEQTRVMFLTASSDREHIITAAKLGVRDYLLKST